MNCKGLLPLMKRESSIDPFDALLQSEAYCFSLRRTVIIPDECRIAPVSATPADIGLGSPIPCCRIEARKSHNEVVAVCPTPHVKVLHSNELTPINFEELYTSFHPSHSLI